MLPSGATACRRGCPMYPGTERRHRGVDRLMIWMRDARVVADEDLAVEDVRVVRRSEVARAAGDRRAVFPTRVVVQVAVQRRQRALSGAALRGV